MLQTQILKPAVWPGWTLWLENGATDTQSFAGFSAGGGVRVGVGDVRGVGVGDGLLIGGGLVLGPPGSVVPFVVGLGFGLAVADGLVVAAGLVLGAALGDAADRDPVVMSDTTIGPAAGRTAQPFVALRR